MHGGCVQGAEARGTNGPTIGRVGFQVARADPDGPVSAVDRNIEPTRTTGLNGAVLGGLIIVRVLSNMDESFTRPGKLGLIGRF